MRKPIDSALVSLLLIGLAVAGATQSVAHADAAPGAPISETVPLEGETVRVTQEQLDLLYDEQPETSKLDDDARAQTRAQVRDVLVQRALLERGALEAALNNDPRVQQEFEAARQLVLANAFKRHLADPALVTTEEVDAEYERAVAQLADVEYRMRRLSYLDKAEAETALQALNGGTPFLEVVENIGGAHPAEPNPDSWRWVLAKRMPLPIREDVERQMREPDSGPTPVQVEGTWYLLQVEGQRATGVPHKSEIADVLREQIGQSKLHAWLAERTEEENLRAIGTTSRTSPAPGDHSMHGSGEHAMPGSMDHSMHGQHEPIGDTLTERLAYMSAHFHAGVILYRNGEPDMAMGHLSHPASDSHEAEWRGLEPYGFDRSLFVHLQHMIGSNSQPDEVESLIERAIANLDETAERARTPPRETLEFLLNVAEREYETAVVQGEIVDEKIYQDVAGYLMVAEHWADRLPGASDRSLTDDLEQLVALYGSEGKAPAGPDAFSDRIRRIIASLEA